MQKLYLIIGFLIVLSQASYAAKDCSEIQKNKELESTLNKWNELFTFRKEDKFLEALNEFIKLKGILTSYYGQSEIKFMTIESPCENIGFVFRKSLPKKDFDKKKLSYVRQVEKFKIVNKWAFPVVDHPESFLGSVEGAAYFKFEASQVCNSCLKSKVKCEGLSRDLALVVSDKGQMHAIALKEVPRFLIVKERGECPEELPERFNSFCRSQKYEDGEKTYMIPEPCS